MVAEFLSMVPHASHDAQADMFRSLIEYHPDAVFALDLQGNVLFANPYAEQLFGYSLHELRAMRYTRLTSEADRLKTIAYFEQAMQGKTQEYELQVMHKEGHLICTHVANIPMFVDGRVSGVYVIVKDITAHKQGELEFRQTVDALRVSETKLQIIEESVYELITIADCDGVIEYASPSHRKVLGFPSDHFVGRVCLDKIHPEDLPMVLEKLHLLVDNKLTIRCEYRHLHADGHWVMVESRGVPVINMHGEVEKVVVVARDISERKQTEELLIKSEKLSIAGQLAAGIAHEIRNPLTAIKGFLQLMQQNKLENQGHLRLMLDEMEHIEEILSELLVFAKPQANHFVTQDLTVILQEVLTLINSQALLHNVQLEVHLPEQPLFITCAPGQIKQVCVHFLKNAIESMPDGGLLRIEALRVDEQVQLHFVDEGCGIPPEIVARLGEPFYTTKEKGTGLGMMVSKRIIESHQGQMTVKSMLNVGTTIEVQLPLCERSLASC